MSKIVCLEKYISERNGHSGTGLPFKKFIKGPVSISWMIKAAKISSSAGLLGCLLWYYYGLSGTPIIRVTSKKLKEIKLPKRTADWALTRLEEAGLVKINRRHGRAPLVRILFSG
jgi:DNA-binding transcriptional ArsR family regulator